MLRKSMNNLLDNPDKLITTGAVIRPGSSLHMSSDQQKETVSYSNHKKLKKNHTFYGRRDNIIGKYSILIIDNSNVVGQKSDQVDTFNTKMGDSINQIRCSDYKSFSGSVKKSIDQGIDHYSFNFKQNCDLSV